MCGLGDIILDASLDLARHALGLRWEDIPASARNAAKTFLHDSLAVGLAGVNAPFADAIFAAASGWCGENGDCRVLGRDARLPPADAAFVNAFQIHAQEFDCVHEPAVVHPLATIAAALLATVDRGDPVTGDEVLTALIAGVDVAAGLGLAATTPLRFFRPATAGVFGSVAAIARLRRLDLETTQDALGYALAFAAGTMQAHVEGLPTLPVQIAQAAKAAVQAVDLARAGLPGPRNAIEGPFGYLTLFEAGFDIDRLREGLGVGHRIEEVSWKPFPTGRAAHGAIVATQRLVTHHGVSAANLARLVYRAPPLIGRLVGRPAKPEMTPAYARLCFAWLGAVVLSRGTVTLDDFDTASRTDPALLDLAARIVVEADDNPDPAAFTPAIAVATLRDGSVIEARIDAQLGSPQFPLTEAQHLAKARACLAFAGFEERHQALADLIGGLDHERDVAVALNAALRPRTR